MARNYRKYMSKKNITIDDLARLVVDGFDKVCDRLNGIDSQMKKMENRMDRLEVGQEDIKLRLDNVAYRFELSDLQKRVTVLEKKASFK